MKIGILTFHWALNYGAVLQAYALQKVCGKMGHDVEIIDYRPTWAKDNQAPSFSLKPTGLLEIANHYIRKKTFYRFRKKYLKCSKRKYNSGDVFDRYDLIIVGSDQVFNPDIISHNNKLDTTYLLATVPEGTRSIAYAASFGNSNLSVQHQQEFQELLSKFQAIGVREYSGEHILRKLNLTATVVPDPTILLGDYTDLTRCMKSKREDYILDFIFHKSDATRQILDLVRRESKQEMRHIAGLYDKIKNNSVLYDISPEKWIQTIANAEFVITDSFHCTVFCILFHTPFMSLEQDGWGRDWSERIKNLLHETGLDNRLISYERHNKKVVDIYRADVDWQQVDKHLERMRKNGFVFLNRNFSTKI